MNHLLEFQRTALSSFSLNPYTNCWFGCAYCYVQKYFAGDFGAYCKPQTDVLESIRKRRYSIRGESVILSAFTDPYPPVESRLGLTREILSALLDVRPRILVVASKSVQLLRDIDLFERFLDSIIVSVSIGSDQDEILNSVESRAPGADERLSTARRLKERGIPVRILVSPLLKHSRQFAEKLAATGATVFVEDEPIDVWTERSMSNVTDALSDRTGELASELEQLMAPGKVFVGKTSLALHSRNRRYH